MTKAPKSEVTRAHILKVALQLFRKRGFDKTTMRDIAKAAEMSLGAAYYYFRAKEEIIFAYYAESIDEQEKTLAALEVGNLDLRQRIDLLMCAKFDTLERDRKFLGPMLGTITNPESKFSIMSEENRDARKRSIALFRKALAPETYLDEEMKELAATAFWLAHAAFLYLSFRDHSPKYEHTRKMIGKTLDLVIPLLALASQPMFEPMRAQLAQLVGEIVGLND